MSGSNENVKDIFDVVTDVALAVLPISASEHRYGYFITQATLFETAW